MSRWAAAWAISALLILAGSPAFAQEANLPAEVRAAIAEMGPKLNPEVIARTLKLMAPLQEIDQPGRRLVWFGEADHCRRPEHEQLSQGFIALPANAALP